jgi:hypothetical protein
LGDATIDADPERWKASPGIRAGSSDIRVMMHVKSGEGFTIAVSENRQLPRITQDTVLGKRERYSTRHALQS